MPIGRRTTQILTIGVSVLEILLGIFLVFVISLWTTGYTGGCGVFGIFGVVSGPANTTRGTILFIAAISAWLGRALGPSLDRIMH